MKGIGWHRVVVSESVLYYSGLELLNLLQCNE